MSGEMVTEGAGAPGQFNAEKFNVSDVINITARLAQLLAEEVDMLGAMKVARIAELQQEKLFLTGVLEQHRKQVARNPQVMDTIPSQDRRDLEGVITVFEDILAENHRRLQMAKEVNHRIVQTITGVVKERSMSNVYDGRGTPGAMGNQALSITLNQTA